MKGKELVEIIQKEGAEEYEVRVEVVLEQAVYRFSVIDYLVYSGTTEKRLTLFNYVPVEIAGR